MIRVWLLVLLVAAFPARAEYSLATFSADVTPPLGHACMGGGILAAKEVIDPLYARGVVLLGSGAPLVFCAVDWCEVRNGAYDLWREELAKAAGTMRERVFFASVHQHDTPVADIAAQQMLDARNLPNALCDVDFNAASARTTADALRAALPGARRVTHYGWGQARVIDVASNRRVVAPDGTVSFPRNSATSDPAVRAAPEGTIDPFLKTLSFWDGDVPLAALHAYAVHPMSFYGKGGISADFPGLARAKRQVDDPAVFQIYFSGCSGDVTAGKFNDGNPANRPVLAEKLYTAMKEAWSATERAELTTVDFRNAPLTLPVREQGGYTEAELEKTLNDDTAKVFARNLAAMGLSWRARHAAGQPIDVPAADFGRAQFLLLPAEAFVGYQLHAQAAAPGEFIFTAGYGECAPGYIPTAEAETENFIETHDWCWVARGAHVPMQAAIGAALGVPPGAPVGVEPDKN